MTCWSRQFVMTCSGRQFVTYLRGHCSMTCSSRHFLSFLSFLNFEFKSDIVPCLIDKNLEFVFRETIW